VFLDGDSVGTTPLTLTSVQAGRHSLRLLPADFTSWLAEPVTDSIAVEPSSVRSLQYRFPVRVLILSSPAEAQVYVDDSLAGSTPLVLEGIPSRLTLRKAGYADTSLTNIAPVRGIVSATLQRTWTHSEEASIFRESEERGPSPPISRSGRIIPTANTREQAIRPVLPK
jgi:hypothetical protein